MDLEGAVGGILDGDEDDNINISDVIEVIQTTDPDFKRTGMFSGGGEVSTAPGPTTVSGHRTGGGATSRRQQQAYVKILEQPASKALRFRYECEGRSAGSIPGASSSPENKTFPAIQVIGYQGRAVVVVSCVTKDPPYRPHPHNLVGREGCRRGVCTLEVSPETMAVTFSNLGIQCVKKKDIEDALKVREEIRVDPFRTGFAHRNQPTSIDLNAVRLCFQVFLEGENRGKFTVPLNPVVSDPIYDKKAMSDLVICKLSDCCCSVAGGKEIILLCEKVAKEDIQVRFYEETNGAIVWEALGDFQPTHVHKQVAISFRTPRYRTLEVPDPVKVYIQLRRPSDGATSESLPFELLPLDSDPVVLKRKRQKFGNDPNNVLRHLQEQEKARNLQSQVHLFNIPADNPVKIEPRDTSPSPYGGQMYASGLSPMYQPQGGTSPQPHYMFPTDSLSPAAGRTPSPLDAQNYTFPAANIPSLVQSTSPLHQPNILVNNVQMSHMSIGLSNYMVAQQNWNAQIPPDETINPNAFNTGADASNAMIDSTPTGLSSVLDLDSQELTQLNSAELADYINSENLTNNLSLSDINKTNHTQDDIAIQQENMTDSFTRLTTATIDNICNLNNMYKPNIKE